jgi:LPXTG-motif cell wall-anchored protein
LVLIVIGLIIAGAVGGVILWRRRRRQAWM